MSTATHVVTKATWYHKPSETRYVEGDHVALSDNDQTKYLESSGVVRRLNSDERKNAEAKNTVKAESDSDAEERARAEREAAEAEEKRKTEEEASKGAKTTTRGRQAQK